MSVVGVIPAAGYATRLRPLTGSKETIPIAGRPVIDYLVERMRVAGCEEIRVVTRPDKHDVIAYAASEGAQVISASPPTLGNSIALALDTLADDDVVLLGFPDSIWEPVDGYRKLLLRVNEGYEAALGLFRSRAPETCDVIVVDESGFVSDVELKSATPSSDVFWGAAAARVRILHGVNRSGDPGALFKDLCRTGLIPAVWLSEHYVDIGTKAGLRQALDSEWTASP